MLDLRDVMHFELLNSITIIILWDFGSNFDLVDEIHKVQVFH